MQGILPRLWTLIDFSNWKVQHRQTVSCKVSNFEVNRATFIIKAQFCCVFSDHFSVHLHKQLDAVWRWGHSSLSWANVLFLFLSPSCLLSISLYLTSLFLFLIISHHGWERQNVCHCYVGYTFFCCPLSKPFGFGHFNANENSWWDIQRPQEVTFSAQLPAGLFHNF